MKLDYLVLAYRRRLSPQPPRQLASALARRGCLERWRGRSLTLFANAELPLRRFREHTGFVIGRLFDAAGTPAADELGGDLFSQAGAEALIDRVWGSYVAFAEDDRGSAVLRDPSGGLACYHATLESVDCFTSLPHLLVDCGLIAADIDWDAIGRSLTRHSARLSATALRGIDEVQPGHLMQLRAVTAATRQVWDAWRHAAQPPVGNGADMLDRTLRSTLGAWARSTSRPLIEISGGLDSALVAAGVAGAAPDAALITFAAAPGDPDETAYARLIADYLGLPLEIASPRVEDVDLTCSLSRDLPRPNARAFTQAGDAQSLRHAQRIGADAFFSGGGGDDVFCYLRTILPAIDRLRAEGVRAMAATAADIAVMNHSTLWEALTRIGRRLAAGPSKPKLDLRFLSKDRLRALPVEEGEGSQRAGPPGKAAHIQGIATIHNYLEGHARAAFAPIVSPLLSQPIVECCLAIPTWRWCEDGRNRAVARRAFAGRLPTAVIERRSKGSFDGFCARLLHRDRSIVHELLVEGRLAGEGFVNRAELAAALRHPSPPAATVTRILTLVDVESWLRCWTSRPRHCG